MVTGVSLDSRSVHPGDLYAALPGLTTHGAAFVAQALSTGAVAVLTDPEGAARIREQGHGTTLLVHPEPRAVLGDVSALIYGTGEVDLRLIGITGTNGKTTTAYLTTSALTALGHSTGLIGTVETRIGDERVRSVRTTPEATDLHALLAVMEERGIDTCVMEVSSHALSQHRVDGVVYDLALFTNLSQDHLDFHDGMEDYFAAKAGLFTPQRARRGLVCIDDTWGIRLAGQSAVPVETLTTRPGGHADWVVTVDPTEPSVFTLRGTGARGGVDLALRSALPGDFNITNTAMAAAALVILGEEPSAVARAVLTDPHVPGRMQVITAAEAEGDGRIPGDGQTPGVGTTASDPRAVVDYAHTPEAIRAALAALRPTTPGALVVVTGAGGDRDRDKREDMGRAAAELADIVVITDDNPRSEDPAAIRAAVRAGAETVASSRGTRADGAAVEIVEVGDRHDAIRAAVAAARADQARTGRAATVAVVGKGHESGQEVAGQVLPFDDSVEVAEALAQPAGEERR